jgi:hypothetical protein
VRTIEAPAIAAALLLALAACAEPPPVPRSAADEVSRGAPASPPAAGTAVDKLPVNDRAMYDEGQLSVDRERGALSYILRDGLGRAVTENEFVRRYQKVTGSAELADYDRNRHGRAIIGFSVVGSLSVVLLFAGGALLSSAKDCGVSDRNGLSTCDTGVAFLVLGTLSLPVGLIGLVAAAGAGPDGSAEDEHFLSVAAARVLVARYNRALLARLRGLENPTDGGATTHSSSLSISPWVGPGAVGVEGSF